jgi:hypothetical protein
MKHVCIILAACAACLLAPPAAADTGLLREVVTENGLNVVVFTSPTPLRAGIVEVTVLATDSASGAPLEAFEFEVSVREQEWESAAPSMVFEGGLDPSDRLVRKAILELPRAGTWTMVISVRSGERSVRVPITVSAGQPLPGWWQAMPLALLGMPFAVLVVVRDRLKTGASFVQDRASERRF